MAISTCFFLEIWLLWRYSFPKNPLCSPFFWGRQVAKFGKKKRPTKIAWTVSGLRIRRSLVVEKVTQGRRSFFWWLLSSSVYYPRGLPLFFNIIAFLSFTLTSKQKEQRSKGKRKEGVGVVIKEVKNIVVWFSLGERNGRILCFLPLAG